jgi:hypothetical protein
MSVLNIDGKEVAAPNPPIYYVKSFGKVIDILLNHSDANNSFEQASPTDKELWRLNDKGLWSLLRRVSYGKDSAQSKVKV